MRAEIVTAIATLRAELAVLEARGAEVIGLLESVDRALDVGDMAEASRLATAACDIEHDVFGGGDAVAELFDSLGLRDGAEDE